jgi:hypothetical protein
MAPTGNILETAAGPKPFRGFSEPRYTSVPDELFDELLPDLSLAELRVLLYIVRRTFGFKKRSDAISISQMVAGIRRKDGHVLDRGTGLSRRALLPALKSLQEKGVIVRLERFDPRHGFQASIYSVRFKESGVGENASPAPGADFSPREGEKISPPLGEAPSPNKIQDPTNSSDNNTPSIPKELTRRFYEALGRKVSIQKLERGEVEIQKLLGSGFSKAEIEEAIGYVSKRYPDTQTISRLPYLIDEALAHREKVARSEKIHQDVVTRADEEQRKIAEESRDLQDARRRFLLLSEEEQGSLTATAPKWMTSDVSRRSWAAARLAKAQKRQSDAGVTVSFAVKQAGIGNGP